MDDDLVVSLAPGHVRLRRTLPAPPAVVWSAWVDPTRTSAWLGRLDGPVRREGDAFAVEHEPEVRSRHEVLTWHPPALLVMTWDFPDEPPSRLSVALSELSRAHTQITLDHDDLVDPAAYASGWHVHLELLAAHVSSAPVPADPWATHDDLLTSYRAQSSPPQDEPVARGD